MDLKQNIKCYVSNLSHSIVFKWLSFKIKISIFYLSAPVLSNLLGLVVEREKHNITDLFSSNN